VNDYGNLQQHDEGNVVMYSDVHELIKGLEYQIWIMNHTTEEVNEVIESLGMRKG
jgi:hypothetical protein|tara:strand:+ start:19539 stop:19703 length:165 start_codon:yes stop_codon:yes gene_type:complete